MMASSQKYLQISNNQSGNTNAKLFSFVAHSSKYLRWEKLALLLVQALLSKHLDPDRIRYSTLVFNKSRRLQKFSIFN